MVVQHNLKAMNANRMLNINAKASSGSTEKLSSGYRVNRAADDAAGLAISEKMRKQIRGLTQGSRNAEDGISCVQTAEGALAEVQDMLQRMNELAVQAANGTNSVTDRKYIQDEIDQLVTEIDRVSETTKFNETYLLKGDEELPENLVHTFNYVKGDKIDQLGTSSVLNAKLDKVMVNYNGVDNVYVVSASISSAGSKESMTADVKTKGSDFTKYLASGEVGTSSSVTSVAMSTSYAMFKNTNLNGVALQKMANGTVYADKDAYIYDTETKNIIHIKATEDLGPYVDHIDGADDSTYTMDKRYRLLYNVNPEVTGFEDTLGMPKTVDLLTKKDFLGATSENQLYNKDGEAITGMGLYKYFNENGDYTGGLYADKDATKKIIENDTTSSLYYGKYITNLTEKVTAALTFSVHAGADSDLNNRISATIDTMSAAGLGVNKLKSSSIGIVDETGDNARESIDVVGEALKIVSTQRSILGAVQNRLEHTANNLSVMAENIQDAESTIRDTDIAEEMMSYTKNNILVQASQAMLAQANQIPQGVLQLLQ